MLALTGTIASISRVAFLWIGVFTTDTACYANFDFETDINGDKFFLFNRDPLMDKQYYTIPFPVLVGTDPTCLLLKEATLETDEPLPFNPFQKREIRYD